MITQSVEITGPALSFLYYLSSSKANEGFLLGSIETRETEVISDNLENGIKQEKIIRVLGMLPYNYFSSNNISDQGIHLDKLFGKNVNIQKKNEIVGWFNCRRNTLFKPSFRETAIHNKLSSKFDQLKGQNFVFALVQDNCNDISKIHESQAKFLKFSFSEKKWIALPGSILNLSKKSTSISHKSLYRSLPSLEPCLVEMFSRQPIAEGLTNRKLIEGVKTNAHKYLLESIGRVSKLNLEVCNLESEISQIEERKLKQIKIKANEQEDDEDNSRSPPILSRRRKVNE